MNDINTLTDSQLADTPEFKWFFDSYLETALWSSVEIDGEGNDLYLYDNYSPEDVSDEALTECKEDCIGFYRLAVAATKAHGGDFEINLSQYGRDFWLTRCGHGTGFWDGDYPEPLGAALTTIANSYGNVDMYLGHDGLIYI